MGNMRSEIIFSIDNQYFNFYVLLILFKIVKQKHSSLPNVRFCKNQLFFAL